MQSRMDPAQFSRLGGGLTGRFPRDVLVLVVTLLATLALGQWSTGFRDLFWLDSNVWRKLYLWKLVTYPFMGAGPPGLLLLLELVFLLLFARHAYHNLGRRYFWRLLVGTSAAAAAAATVVDVIGGGHPLSFVIMLGQRTLMVIFITVFAAIHANANIMFLMVFPIQARWFLVLELVLVFFAFLQTGDFAGFVGLTSAIGITYSWLQPGGAKQFFERHWLQLRNRWIRFKIDRQRDRRGQGFEEVPRRDDDWVN